MLTGNIGSTLTAKCGNIQTYKVGSQHIWRGATVAVHLDDGLAYPATDSDEGHPVVVGVALEEGKPGGEVRARNDLKYKRSAANPSQNWVGKLACVADDESVQLPSTAVAKIVVGRITEVEEDGVYVDFQDRPARVATSDYD